MGRLPRRLETVLGADRPALCLCLTQARTPDVVLVAAASGFDAVYVDLQHGVTPLDVTSMLCSTALGAGLFPLVRVPSSDAGLITRVLDGGALGVIVPHVDDARQARLAVDACRFPPLGQRSPYAATPVTAYRPMGVTDLAAALDDEVLVAVMIESEAAVAAAPAIAAIEGVDLLLVGAHDLSIDLGVPGEPGHPSVLGAIDAVAEACATHDRLLGVAGLADPEALAKVAARGLAFVSAGSDIGLFQAAATDRVAALGGLRTRGKDDA